MHAFNHPFNYTTHLYLSLQLSNLYINFWYPIYPYEGNVMQMLVEREMSFQISKAEIRVVETGGDNRFITLSVDTLKFS